MLHDKKGARLSRRHSEITHPIASPGYREDRQRAAILHFTIIPNQHHSAASCNLPRGVQEVHVECVFQIYFVLKQLLIQRDTLFKDRTEHGPVTDVCSICKDSTMTLGETAKSTGVQGCAGECIYTATPAIHS